MTFRGVVAGAFVDGDGPPTSRDLDELEAFRRFLRDVAPLEDEHPGWVPRRAAGWLPYALGAGPAPPVGADDVALTAWTFPA